ncbi:MAG: eukaryotic-like serine/threonine-protein kinase [Myxococcales bacterium]|nr:eukaryotic-like serine/threonine-protein kinase [Myxococcales bacterium]
MTGGETGTAFQPGHVVAGRYELVELLGQGGHGAVYRAIQRPLGREVAIKMILVEAIYADGMLERFAREAALVQRLEHPNTVRLFDFGTTEQGLPYIVFELLRGRTLAQELERGTLTPFRVGRVATQVLNSLMEAHALGIVHRDIKPSNVLLVDYSGETDFVKVLDFGVARTIKKDGDEKAGITHDGQIIGTPSYMAPEQIRGAAVGPQADLYALGLVMAEALTGKQIYGGDTAMQIWIKQTSDEKVPLPHVVLGSVLGPVIARATAKSTTERYPSAAAMREELETLLSAASAATDPLAKPMVPELTRITARMARDLTPGAAPAPPPATAALPPIVPRGATPQPARPSLFHPPSSSSSSPTPSSQSPSSSSRYPTSSVGPTGAGAAIVILGVVAIVALLLAAGAGIALYMSRRAGPADAPPVVGSSRPTP